MLFYFTFFGVGEVVGERVIESPVWVEEGCSVGIEHGMWSIDLFCD